MASASRMIFRAIALFLMFCLAQVYLVAKPLGTSVAADKSENSAAGDSLSFARLITHGSKLVTVNGNRTLSGATIFSGAQLVTPDSALATVQLGSAGKLDISPNTNLVLTFDKNSVDVKLLAGNVFLSTGTGVKGSVTMPDGKIIESAPMGSPAGVPVPPAGGPSGMQWGLIFIVIAIAAPLIAVAASNRCETPTSNPSPIAATRCS